jgi:Mor family transcriptional regulator
MSLGYEVDEAAELLSFSPRWVRALIKRYNESGAEVRNIVARASTLKRLQRARR